MRKVLPGKVQATLQAVCTAYWEGRRLIAYISGNALVILEGTETILQTIYEDEDVHLEAVTIDEVTGKIAICQRSNVRVYQPSRQGENALKWSLQHSLSVDADGKDTARVVSWGSTEELLVGGLSLTLLSTTDATGTIWKKKLANEIKFAQLSYDSAYIASTGVHDPLLKIWRRLSFGAEDTNFDFSYLRHPTIITNIHWRRPLHHDQSCDSVLYTFCADNILRVWASMDHHGLQILQLWTQIDLLESIQARGMPLSNLRFAFIIDGKDFMAATESAVQEKGGHKDDHAMVHLVEVANRNPEICVILDDRGHLSAWGLENVGCKSQQSKNIFNIAHVDGLALRLPSEIYDRSGYIRIHNYGNKSGGGLHILLHHFDGKIEVYSSNVADLFDPSPRTNRLTSQALWTGHSEPIKKIIRNVNGRAVVSRTDKNETIIWNHGERAGGTSIVRQSVLTEDVHIHRLCVLRKGSFVFLLHHDSVTLWDARPLKAVKLASLDYAAMGKTLCLLKLPGDIREGPVAHVATITSKLKGLVWEIHLPVTAKGTEPNGHFQPFIREYCRFDLGKSDDLAYVLPVDPAGSPPQAQGFLDTFARDIALSYTHTGLLRAWTARLDIQNKSVDWLETCSVDTGIYEPALASGSSRRKAALVDSQRSTLTIWDVRGAQLEYSANYEREEFIQDLDWTSTPDDQSILAVGFQHRVLLLAQLRYDYLDKGAAWASIRKIDIRDMSPHPIGDSAWLSDGNLIIGAGNQLFVYDKMVDTSDPASTSLGLAIRQRAWDLFDVVSRLNGPLPVYHPQFLGQCTIAGKNALVQKILLALYKALNYFVEGEHLDKHLDLAMEEFYAATDNMTSSAHKETRVAFDALSDDGQVETVTEGVAAVINAKLTTITIPQLTRQEQIRLADLVECVAVVEKQRRSMDDNAARFMLIFRQYVLRRGRAKDISLSWREINFAYHSNSQDILIDMISHQFQGKMLWEHARETGIFTWITDANALKAQFEAIARNEYTKSDEKNPVDCTIFYIALRKKVVLQGLWRMASWNREQAATLRLLSNNFQHPKWKTAALKNAYALLGKKRNEYAAAFFLLADHLKDCVGVILNQLKDLQLAIAVTRVYEGEGGPMLRELLRESVLPLAAKEGNRWLASWAFWMLHRRDMSVRALISPVCTLLETPLDAPPDIQAKLFLTDDPALVVLYSQLRHKTLQTLRGASQITPKVEWEFILHNASLYDRMGCDLLALDLVRNWEFLLAPPLLGTPGVTSPILQHSRTLSLGLDGDIVDPSKLLRRRSSLVVADLPMNGKPVEMKADTKDRLQKPPPSMFQEPETSSLLDTFGF